MTTLRVVYERKPVVNATRLGALGSPAQAVVRSLAVAARSAVRREREARVPTSRGGVDAGSPASDVRGPERITPSDDPFYQRTFLHGYGTPVADFIPSHIHRWSASAHVSIRGKYYVSIMAFAQSQPAA